MNKWEEFKFKIEAYTPDTLPMARCASYLNDLASMLGEVPHVHFVGLEAGSSVLAYKVDYEAVPKVRQRTEAIKSGKGTVDEMRAFNRINRMLRDDNATGALMGSNNVKIIQFPGKDEKPLHLSSVHQQGEVDGELLRVGGSGDMIPILLRVEGREISGCRAKKEMAKHMAKHLFEPVRFYGEGRWERSDDGEWDLIHFTVDRFIVLHENTLSETVAMLREIAKKGDWGENAFNDLLTSRHSDEEAN